MPGAEFVWWNGKIVPESSVRLSLYTHTLHYGAGVFEGIRAYAQKDGSGAVFRLRDHMVRFEESMKILGLPLTYSTDALTEAVLETLRKNGLNECYIRPLAFIGETNLGINPGTQPPIEVAILAWKWGKYFALKDGKGIRLMTSSFVRGHVNSAMSKGKITGQYVPSVLAKRESLARGFDDAVMLDPEGYVAEGTGANIFLVKKGVVKTTPLNSILNGITRQTIITRLRELGLTVEEMRFTRDELWCADEVFLTGTAAEISPVGEIDERSIGKVGPVTSRLMEDFEAVVRGSVEKAHPDWLTRI